jgi:hypothetical protein
LVRAEAEGGSSRRWQHDFYNTKQDSFTIGSYSVAHYTNTAMGRLCKRLQPRQGKLAKAADEEEYS